MTDLDKMAVRLDALTRRVKVLEVSVRPLTNLQGVDGNLVADQAVVAFVAESVGSTLATVAGTTRTREATAARRSTARLLHERAKWSLARIGRGLSRTESGVRSLLESGK